MMGDQARLVGILVGPQADTAKPRALVIVPVFHTVEPQLVLKQVSEESSEAPGGEWLAPGIIDPGPVMRVEPAILMFIPIALVQLVGTPDIDDRQGVSLGIRAGVAEERLIGPLGERVGIDQALRPWVRRALSTGSVGAHDKEHGSPCARYVTMLAQAFQYRGLVICDDV
jgi:hypothetical protein